MIKMFFKVEILAHEHEHPQNPFQKLENIVIGAWITFKTPNNTPQNPLDT